MVVQVPGQEEGVHTLLAGYPHHLVEGPLELGHPRAAPDGPPHVPVARMQQPHAPSLLAPAERITQV